MYAGQAGQPKFKVGDAVVVRELPVIFYTRTPEYVRGAKGEIAAVAYESPAAEDETWDRPGDTGMVLRRPVQHVRACGTATPEPPDDVIATEIPERWLHAAK